MTDEEQAEYDILKRKVDARRDRPGFKQNVDEIEARLRELDNAS